MHGGAGAMRTMGPEKERAYRAGLDAALRAGAEHLSSGGDAVTAAIAAVSHMERCGHFNAGRGSGLTLAGEVEVDAAVMVGTDLSYGSVAAVPGLINAIELAEMVRTASVHCMLAGARALEWANHLASFEPLVEPPTPKRLETFRQRLKEHNQRSKDPRDLTKLGGTHDEGDTVGAVALDGDGQLAAAVSTGGIWLKQPGRVGDSPIAGSGLWAEDNLVACAGTGTGEFIMRAALASDIRARMQRGDSVTDAASSALGFIRDQFGPGLAGVIALSATGEVAMPFDTAGMGRGWWRAGEEQPTVRVWPEDEPEFSV